VPGLATIRRLEHASHLNPTVEDRLDRLISWLTLLFVLLTSGWLFSAALRQHSSAMRFLEDDFFYYAKIAVNIAAGRGSTFDGVTPTNGYHPLYFLVLLPAAWVRGGLTPFLVELWLLAIAASVVTFVFARRIFRAAGCDEKLASALGLLAIWLPMRMFYQSMEVTLTIPLAMVLLWLCVDALSRAEFTWRRAAVIGIVAAAMVLSRLDSSLLVMLLVLAVMCEGKLRRALTPAPVVAFMIAGGAPILVYLASNQFWFHTWMPISGMAKQERFSHAPSYFALYSALWGKALLLLGMDAAALLTWLVWRRKMEPRWRAVLLAAILFPLLQIGLFSILSDWQMWGWYHYTFVPALLALLAMLVMWWQRAEFSSTREWARPAGYVLLGIAAVVTAANHWKMSDEMVQISEAAEQLQIFAATHPGKYAMGDRAGMVGWLLPEPLFQTEGLVEDRAWLTTLHAQGDLADALRERGVRYYVTTVWPESAVWAKYVQRFSADVVVPAGCTLAIEPEQAGPTAPHLRTVLCSPLATIAIAASGNIPGKKVLVFDLFSARPQRAAAQPAP